MKNQAGFSAVELLITLFIAVIFIGTGYQLYSVVIKNGGDTSQRAIASSIAYENLRRYAPQTSSPCSTTVPAPAPSIPANSGIANAAISVTFECPFGTSGAGGLITKVAVSVTYGTPQQEVVHAIYVNK